MRVSVETGSGRLRGSREGGAAVFLGVPYAAPPLASLRWRPPQPVESWTDDREATRFGCVPPQSPDPVSAALGLEPEQPHSEDCLTLNVFTPACDEQRRPVLVWLPGGAFISGGAGAAVYDGRRLALRGDVVVVTVNYRVGALGFLHLGPGAEACNFGLQDQLAALAWVQREIERFGGDPECVTVFGESAGAGSVVSLLTMPAARGLFHRAIVQSAAPDGMITPDDAEDRAERLLTKLGVGREDRAGLEGVGVEALLAAQQELLGEAVWKTGMLFAPVIDGELLPRRPLEAIAAGAAREVELLIGTTRDEMRLYVGGPFEPPNEEAACAMLAAQLPGGPDPEEAARLLAVTRAGREERGETSEALDVYYAAQTDLYLRVPAMRLAEGHAERQPGTFMYSFEWPSPADGGIRGACHAIDLAFTFGNLDAPRIAGFAGAGPEAERLAGHVMDAWCAFARGGRPGHAGIGAWPPYEPTRRSTMVLGERCGIAGAPFEAERLAWLELFERSG